MNDTSFRTHLPPQGSPPETLWEIMTEARSQDAPWQAGRVFSLVFWAGDDVAAVAHEAYSRFFAENALNPSAFPSLRRFETEVISMTAHLLGGDDEVVGNMTSGGTESILMAMKTARDWARAQWPQRTPPEVVLPATAHPAFAKAAHYFGLTLVPIPVQEDFRADVAAMAVAISPRTVMLVASAPSYPQGIVDPVAEIATLAQERGLLCHVDACVGGMMLPFIARLGYPVPPFDFRVPGVTSLSVDLHKYGYAAKGASVILYRHAALRRQQMFASTDWSGGIYASPTMTGTRPGGAIAAAWAVMNYLGEAGYLRLARTVMKTTQQLQAGVTAIPGLQILGKPTMSVFAIASPRLDMYEVGDEMTLRGWHLDRQQAPPSLHLTIHAGHAPVVPAFLADIADAAAAAARLRPRRLLWQLGQRGASGLLRRLPPVLASRLTEKAGALLASGGDLPQRSAPLYGMMGTLPHRQDVEALVLDLLDGFTRPPRGKRTGKR